MLANCTLTDASVMSFCRVTMSLCESCNCHMQSSTRTFACKLPSTIGGCPRSPHSKVPGEILQTTSRLAVPGGSSTLTVSSVISCVHR